MIALYTDFGTTAPYVGQVHAVLAARAPDVPIIDLFHDVPRFDIRAGAYLLPALAAVFPAGTVFLGVVDPGVGGARRPIVLKADGRWYVGPDNGLFELVGRRARDRAAWVVDWRPERLSESFHGRDLFAPVAAALALGEPPPGQPASLTPPPGGPWPDDWAAIIYLDTYGNATTGLRATGISRSARLAVAGRELSHARVYSEVAPGEAFWYENANGLIEIAVNRGSAAEMLGITVGDGFTVV